MEKKSFDKVCIILIILNFFYFFSGFYFQHDFSNGGKIDFEHIYKNFELFKNSSLLQIDWKKYESTSLPLHYLITKFIIPENNVFAFKFYTFFLSLLCIPIFYVLLKIKLNLNKFNFSILLICTILLISSSFRTDGFYGLEENIGFFLFLTSFVFFYLFKKTNFKKYMFLTIFFSCLVFYTRQTYAFVSIITYFYFLDKENLLSKHNLLISFLYFIFLLPSIYFFYSWGSVVPVDASFRLVKFQFYSIPLTLGMFIIFTFPFYLYNFQRYLKKIDKNKFFFILFFFIIYAFLFWQIPINNFGGGPLAKIMLINTNFKIIFLFFSFLGLLTVYDLSKKNINILIFCIFFLYIYVC